MKRDREGNLFMMEQTSSKDEDCESVNTYCENETRILEPPKIDRDIGGAKFSLMPVKIESTDISEPVGLKIEDAEESHSVRQRRSSRLIPRVNYAAMVNDSDINPKLKRDSVPKGCSVNPKFRVERNIKVEPKPDSQRRNRAIKMENDFYSEVTLEPNTATFKTELGHPVSIYGSNTAVGDLHDAAIDKQGRSKGTNLKTEDISNGEDLVKNIKKMVSMKMKASVVDSPSAYRYLRRRNCPNTKIEPDEFFNEILKDVGLSHEQSETILQSRCKIDISKPETITFTDGFKFHLCLVCGYQTHVPAFMTNHVRIHTGEKPYACDECNYRSCTSQSLRLHKRTHTGEKPYSCTYCSYATRSSTQLKYHTMVHEGKKPHKCSTCEFRCRDPKALKEHIRCHTGEKPYACPLCDYRCSKNGSIKLHMRTHSGEKPFKCSFCDYSSTCSSSLTVHIRRHTGEKPYSCEFCSYKSSSGARLRTHTRTHTGARPFQCNLCGYRSATQGRLASHMKTHTGVKPHECPHCDYKSSRSDNLKVHLLKHTGEKPYACHLCEYRACEKAQLKNHIRRHTGEKPYACETCGFRAIDSSSLKKHEKSHSSDKPLKCDFCDYKTGRAGSLKTHVMRHTGDRPYSCPYCSYRSIKSETVKNHVRSYHNVTNLDAPTLKEYSCASCLFHTYSRKLMESHAVRHIGHIRQTNLKSAR